MGSSNSSGGVLHLEPVPASEPVDHWCCLHIKPYWLAIPNKKEDNFLRTMRGFLNLFCKFCANNVRSYIEIAKPKHSLRGSKMNRWPGLARHLSWLQSRSQLTTADSLKTLIATSELPPRRQDINPHQSPGCRTYIHFTDWVFRHSTINCA